MPRIPFLSTPARLRLAHGWVWAVMPWLLAGAVMFIWSSFRLWEADAFLHVRLGQWMLDGGSPSGNPDWTYGPNSSWRNTMAMAEVIYAGLYNLLGWGGVCLIFWVSEALLLPLAWYSFAQVAPRAAAIRGPGPARAAVAMLSIVTVVSAMQVTGMTARPMSVSLIVTPVLAVAMLRLAITGKWPSAWVAVPLTWLWASWHGYGMLVGPLLFASAVAHVGAVMFSTRQERRWSEVLRSIKRVARGWHVLVGTVAVTFMTPAGIYLWASALKIREASLSVITEWQPTAALAPTTFTCGVLVLIWVGSVISTGFAARSGAVLNAGTRRSIVAEGFLILGLTYILVGTYRTSAFLIMFLIVIVAHRIMKVPAVRDLRPREWEAWPGTGKMKWLIVSFPLISMLMIAWNVHTSELDPELLPVTLLTEMAQDFKADPANHRLLVHFNDSSPAGMLLPEGVQISIDGRTDRYGPDVLPEYRDLFFGGYKWEEILERDFGDTTDALLDKKFPLTQLLIDRGWIVEGSQKGVDYRDKPMTWVWLRAPGEQPSP